MADHDPEFEAWVERARRVSISDVTSYLGIPNLRKTAGELVGPCPKCGGTDRFSINPGKGAFNCRGAEGGDAIKLVMHVEGRTFVQACEFILNEPPPHADSKVEPRPIDDRAAREHAEDRENEEAIRREEEQRNQARKASAAAELFERASPFAGSHAEAYLLARVFRVLPEATLDLRFFPKLEYRGYANDNAEEETVLGEFPCMVAAMRNLAGEIVGLHRTYLDPKRPMKLKAPGCSRRNLAKKMFGSKGLILLGPVRPIMAVGEGIETTLAWGNLDRFNDDFCLAAAGDRGNLSGGSTGTILHPLNLRRTMPNGIPDPAKPGMPIPAAVRELILLGDADKDPHVTIAHLRTAGARHRDAGRKVWVDMSPLPEGQLKWDWADVLEALQGAGRAA